MRMPQATFHTKRVCIYCVTVKKEGCRKGILLTARATPSWMYRTMLSRKAQSVSLAMVCNWAGVLHCLPDCDFQNGEQFMEWHGVISRLKTSWGTGRKLHKNCVATILAYVSHMRCVHNVYKIIIRNFEFRKMFSEGKYTEIVVNFVR